MNHISQYSIHTDTFSTRAVSPNDDKSFMVMYLFIEMFWMIGYRFITPG